MFLLTPCAEISQHKKTKTKFSLAVLPFAAFQFCPIMSFIQKRRSEKSVPWGASLVGSLGAHQGGHATKTLLRRDLGRFSKHGNKPLNIKHFFRIVLGEGGGQNCLFVAFFLWKRETDEQNSQEDSGKCRQNSPRTIPGQFREHFVDASVSIGFLEGFLEGGVS